MGPAPALGLLAVALVASQAHGMPVRWWLDSYHYSEGETTLLKEEIERAGPAQAVLAGEARTRFFTSKGYHGTKKWDVCVGGREGCLQVLAQLEPGQKVNCVPGLTALTDKARLISTLTKYYGARAFEVIPRSYRLPEGYWTWRDTLQSKADRDRLWVLKLNAHRGAGVAVLPQHEALERALDTNQHGDFTYELVQAFLGDQYLVDGRRFYMRLWVLVTDTLPLRAYLYDGGVVVLGSRAEPGKAPEHIVNLWTQDREAADPLSLKAFLAHVARERGAAAAQGLWEAVQETIARTMAAGVVSMRVAAADYGARPGTAFEYVGVDILVDAGLHPWLVEVNAVPSLARQDLKAKEGKLASAFDQQKEAVVGALFKLLQATAGPEAAAAGAAGEAQAPGGAAACSVRSGLRELEAATAAGWIPLRAMAAGNELSNRAAGLTSRLGQNVTAASKAALATGQQARQKVARWSYALRWLNPWAYAQYMAFEFGLKRVGTLRKLAGWLAWLFRWNIHRQAKAAEERVPALQGPIAAAMRLGEAVGQGGRGAIPLEEADLAWDQLIAQHQAGG